MAREAICRLQARQLCARKLKVEIDLAPLTRSMRNICAVIAAQRAMNSRSWQAMRHRQFCRKWFILTWTWAADWGTRPPMFNSLEVRSSIKLIRKEAQGCFCHPVSARSVQVEKWLARFREAPSLPKSATKETLLGASECSTRTFRDTLICASASVKCSELPQKTLEWFKDWHRCSQRCSKSQGRG